MNAVKTRKRCFYELIQEAYECLSDAKERVWYDKHRDHILSGRDRNDIVDTSFDVFPYFSSSSYSAFDDSENGFYTVYRNVFDTIAKEDLPFRADDSETVPNFGFSNSSYSDVHAFYAYWQSYCTPRDFSWLDKYDILSAPNRRFVRLMEKENRKLREAGKRKRNEEIRQLVAFVRRRDKRVQAQRKANEVKINEKRNKTKEYRLKQIEEQRKEFESFKESDWTSMSTLEEELQQIENSLEQENDSRRQRKQRKRKQNKKLESSEMLEMCKDNEEENETENIEEFEDLSDVDLYCIACDKAFKSSGQISNPRNDFGHGVAAGVVVDAESEVRKLRTFFETKKAKRNEEKMGVRTFEEERAFLEKIGPVSWKIKKGFVPNMKVEGIFYVNSHLEKLMFEELRNACKGAGFGGFLPAVKQIGNVASLSGIVGNSIGLPDCHSGYGFAIGNMAAFDMSDKYSIVSPGGVGFDINCGVRLLRTNLMEKDVDPVKEQVAQSMFDHIPVGVGSKGIIPMNARDLEEALEMGVDWSLREGYAWAEDKEHCEEYGRMLNADPAKVSLKAKKRGLPQLGTLGAGNHYAEIQVVDEIYDVRNAAKMGIECTGQVCVMIHSGSRGFGHQVATDALLSMEKAMKRDKIEVNDRQLACAYINSNEGQDYLKAMAAAANFAWVNRSSMTFLTRQAFSKTFNTTPDDLDMQVIYDVSHNIAKIEEHMVNGKPMKLLVHRKGSTRAFPPHHPLIPVDYQLTGQPVLIGGSMGTCSYVLTGTEKGMRDTFGTTCHGAGRALSRSKSRRNLSYEDVLDELKKKGIAIRVASPKLVMEEAPESYKNVTDVVNTCHEAGISMKCFKLRPIAVIKG
ncbi:hypothetical protein B4U79_11484 [Dinothrombium tinctorium]|uniref:RNA-splicing ligase RtcB homolog n=1 Tax=Dinothrombium tinctorium TaxID=1965070 RepID=A0A443RQ14_9ACAR|nr:hypothetical protein B4U79_11484 [Dinothrombium tinctorium]